MKEREPPFFGSWKGRIIKAIAIDGARTWNDIKEMTGLYPNTMKTVLRELFSEDAIFKIETKDPVEYRVKKDLYQDYKEYFDNLLKERKPQKVVKITSRDQDKIERIVQEWKDHNKVNVDLSHKHFYLYKRNLDDFSKYLIREAQKEIFVINPFVERCDLTESLLEVSSNVNIKLITRSVKEKDYNFIKKLQDSSITILTNDIVHAKIIAVDKGVVVVSSMNFYAASSGGKTWEAGIVSISEATVLDVIDSILTLEEDYDSVEFK